MSIARTFSLTMASSAELPSYTIIHVPSDMETPSESQLKADLEKGDTKTKIAALKKTIQMILNGEKLNNLLMTIIRFVLPSQVNDPSCRRWGNSSGSPSRILFIRKSRNVSWRPFLRTT